MDDEQRREIMRQARENVERADEALDRCAIDSAARQFDQPDALEAWRATMPPKPKEERVTPDELNRMVRREIARQQPSDAMSKVQVRAEIQSALEQFASMLGEEIGLTQKHQLSKMQAEIDGLRAEINTLRCEVRREPVELPKLQLIGGRRA